MNNIHRAIDWLYITIKQFIRPIDPQGNRLSHRRRNIRNAILEYYQQHPTQDAKILDALSYLSSRTEAVFFPSSFRDKHFYRHLHIGIDEEGSPYYDLDSNKRLFFIKNKRSKVARYLNSLLIEQDEHSPHRYLTSTFNVGPDDVLVDVGSAEGILTLQVIDRIRKAYLFESDPAWIEVLYKTFAPWKDKVVIIPKFVADTDDNTHVRLDTFFAQERINPTFIKLDVEGSEQAIFDGMKGLLDANLPLKMAVCTYHLSNSYEQITNYVTSRGFHYETSKGYLLFGLYDGYKPPYFRRGLIRAYNK